MDLVAPQHVESSQTRDQTHVPALAGIFLSTASPWSLKLPNCFSKQLWHSTFPPSVYKALISLHSHKTLVIICLFYSHSSEDELVSHHGFDCNSLLANDTEHLFICLLAIYIFSLKKCLFRVFAHFLIFFWPLHEACWISVPHQGLNSGYGSESPES